MILFLSSCRDFLLWCEKSVKKKHSNERVTCSCPSGMTDVSIIPQNHTFPAFPSSVSPFGGQNRLEGSLVPLQFIILPLHAALLNNKHSLHRYSEDPDSWLTEGLNMKNPPVSWGTMSSWNGVWHKPRVLSVWWSDQDYKIKSTHGWSDPILINLLKTNRVSDFGHLQSSKRRRCIFFLSYAFLSKQKEEASEPYWIMHKFWYLAHTHHLLFRRCAESSGAASHLRIIK